MIEKIDNIRSLKEKGIFTQRWEPEKNIKAGMILVHGLGEHSDRYKADFGNYFTNAGFVIQTFDLPGHGRSDGIRGYIPDYQNFYDIISQCQAHLREMHSNIPLFIYGHSLGGLVILDHLFQGYNDLAGFISSAPVLDVFQPIAPIKKFIAKVLKNILPTFTMDSGLEVDNLSKDKSVVEKYINDPLVHAKTSSYLGAYIIERGAAISAAEKTPGIPGLVMVGSEDVIVSKDAIIDFCEREENIELKIWDSLYHEIHNEPEKKAVFDFTLNWISRIL